MNQDSLHTIGYEGSSIEAFLATLQAKRIDLLIDIRDVPISRKPGFSKTALSGWLASCNIQYLHLKGLGDPKPGRIAAREGRYEDFHRIFGSHLKSPVADHDMQRGLEAATTKLACLMCFERDHRYCHRSIVGEELARRGSFRLLHVGVEIGWKIKTDNRDELSHGGALALAT